MEIDLIKGLFIGVLFGIILYKAGVSGAGCIYNALTLKDMKAVKMMLTAIAVGAIIVWPLADVMNFKVLPTYGVGVILGGLIFGAGFGYAGYCPGTLLVAIGAGMRDGIYALLGGLAGALAYALVFPGIKDFILKPMNLGKMTLPRALGTDPTVTGVVFGLVLLAVVYLIDRIERSRSSKSAQSESARRAPQVAEQPIGD